MLLFDVSGQSLKRTDHFNPATDSVEYLKAKFTFNDSAWNGKTKTALFRLGTAVYKSVLGSDGACKVPSEVLVGGESRLARIHGETIHVSLIGEYGTTRITTNEIAVKLNRSGYGDAQTPANPTESEYQQMATVAADAVAEAGHARTACENARADLVGVKNLFANAIKGNLSGAVVFADDVSPVEHEMTVKARGANLISFPYYNKSGVINGITYTINDDGSITAKGTATANAALYLTYGLSGIKGTVFLSGCPDGGSISASSGGGYSLRMNKVVNGAEVTGGVDVGSGNKITLNGESIRVYIVVLSGKTVDCTFRPMLNYGESANGFVKSDLTTMLVRRCGKNLVPALASGSSVESNGVKFKVNDAGGIVVSGTPTGVSRMPLYSGSPLARTGMITLSLSGSFSNIVPDFQLLNTAGTITKHIQTGTKATLNLDDYPEAVSWVVAIKRGENGVATNGTVYVQVEVGSVATEYEKGIPTETYIPSTDGTVSGITSLSPNMTILTGTDGAIVECEYIRDSNKVIEKLTNAIIALGGTV